MERNVAQGVEVLRWLAEAKGEEGLAEDPPGSVRPCIRVGNTPASAVPLERAWVYWRAGGRLRCLRTDGAGLLLEAPPGANRQHSWEYTTPFLARPGTEVDLAVTRGSIPLPDSGWAPSPDAFVHRTLTAAAGGLTALIVVPALHLVVSTPADLSLWPVLFTHAPDTYATDGLNQGAALWTGTGALTVTENGPAAAPPAAVRPTERGLVVQGTIDARATGVKVKLFGTGLAPILFRSTGGGTVDEVTAALGPASTGTKPFEVVLTLADAAAAFGPVVLLVTSDGMTPRVIGVFFAHLAGLAIALVNDTEVNVNGQVRGPLRGEANEVVIVDFIDSPQTTRAALTAQTRARRMVRYALHNRNRPIGGTGPSLPHPEMPMWMGEFQIVGLNRAELESLMVFRKNLLASAPTGLSFELDWRITLSWDGPDSGTGSPRLFNYTEDFTGRVVATVRLDAAGMLDGVDATGNAAGAIAPAPAVPGFPATGRRAPNVIVSGQTRPWGRQAGAPVQDTVVIEWQPRIVNGAGGEVLRGGDGRIAVVAASIGGARIDRGRLSGGGAPPAAEPDLGLPRFRVAGLNLAGSSNALVNELVREHHAANAALGRVRMLPLAVWQETIRLIIAHESGRQFENRGAGRRLLDGLFYGHEQDMPFFGGPHGYVWGQLDTPPVTVDGAWSFLENLRETVRQVMEDKGGAAFVFMSPHLAAATTREERAVFRREVVRRYNGGREFAWSGTGWHIDPSTRKGGAPADHSLGANPRLLYPNNVLGTAVVYSNGAGAATAFPWPIAFAVADYGPGI